MKISRKTTLLAGFLLGLILPLAAQVRTTREEYIDRYKSIAIAQMERYGIPASITLAQGILESDCGNSLLSMRSNNHFGIKCKRDWTGEKVYHDDDAKGECFRAYPTVEASYHDHAEFLDKQPRYDSLFAYASDDYKSWARGLKAAGYATAPAPTRSGSSASSRRASSSCSTVPTARRSTPAATGCRAIPRSGSRRRRASGRHRLPRPSIRTTTA